MTHPLEGRRRLRSGGLLLLALLPVTPEARGADDPAPDPKAVAFFEKKVRPLLVTHCYSCHSADAKKVRGGLRLDTAEGVRRGGASGPVVAPGDPERSALIRAVRHADEELR